MKTGDLKFIGIVVGLLCLSTSAPAQRTVELYTPNGTIVQGFYESEWSAQEIEDITNQIRNDFSEADVLEDASKTYNCHSYAWYLSEGGSVKCWIPDFEIIKYIEDDSYYEVNESEAEKIVYYREDGLAIHSAIVSNIPGKYISKWGPSTLMRHAPMYVPGNYDVAYRKYYKRTVSISEPEPGPDPVISGPDQFCDQAVYTLNYLPAGATVNWHAARLLNINSGQGTTQVTVSKAFTGAVLVLYADITINGVTNTISKSGIRVGTIAPAIEVYDSTGSNILGPPYLVDTDYYIVANAPLTAYEPANNFLWIMPNEDNFPGLTTLANGYRVPFRSENTDTYTFQLQYYNADECGWSDPVFRTISLREPLLSPSIYPNPAINYIEIELNADYVAQKSLSKQTVSIYDMAGNTVIFKEFKANNAKITIDVSGLKSGQYTVVIADEKQKSTQKLTIE